MPVFVDLFVIQTSKSNFNEKQVIEPMPELCNPLILV